MPSSVRVSAISLFRERLWKSAARRMLRRKSDGPWMFALPGDAISDQIIAVGIFDKIFLSTVFDLLQDYLHPDDTCAVDVGAHIGNHTIQFAKRFRHVYSFEPSPILYSVLSANLLANDISNVSAMPLGLGSVEGEFDYFRGDRTNTGNGGFVAAFSGTNNSVRLRVTRGDTFFANMRPEAPISLIKVDTEGYEPEVIIGLSETISRYKPVLFLERWGRDGAADPIESLRRLGYSRFFVIRRYGTFFPEYRLVPMVGDQPETNVVAVF